MVGPELLCVNLAAADFFCCVCFYPLSISSSFRHAWVGGRVTCSYYGFGCFVFGLASMFTITAISVLRYLKTCYSLAFGEVCKRAPRRGRLRFCSDVCKVEGCSATCGRSRVT